MARELVNLIQGSQEWLDVRRSHITGTEVAHIWCGKTTLDELRLEKLGLQAVPDLSRVPAVQEGKLFEPLIRNYLATNWRNVLCPQTGVIQDPCLESEEEPFFMVSLDGITENGTPIEIKNTSSSNKKAFDEVQMKGAFSKSGKANGYYAQLQWEMYLTEAQEALFVCHQSNDGKTLCPENIKCLVVKRDESVIKELVDIGLKFKDLMLNNKTPDSLVYAGRQVGGELATNEEVLKLVAQYREAEEQYQVAKTATDALKTLRNSITDKLVSYLPDGISQLEGTDYVVSRVERRGSIDTQKLIDYLVKNGLMTVDEIEQYRGKTSFTNSVKLK